MSMACLKGFARLLRQKILSCEGSRKTSNSMVIGEPTNFRKVDVDFYVEDFSEDQQSWIREKAILDELSRPPRSPPIPNQPDPLASHPLPHSPRVRRREQTRKFSRSGCDIIGFPSRDDSTLLLTEPTHFIAMGASKDSLTLRGSDDSDTEWTEMITRI